MNITLTLTDNQTSILQELVNNIRTTHAMLPCNIGLEIIPITIEEFLNQEVAKIIQAQQSRQTERNIQRVASVLRQTVDTGEFLGQLADAAEKSPEQLATLLTPKIAPTPNP